MNKEIFKEIGFTDGEVNVYFALLDLGETTTGPLIKRSNISGSKVYEILEKLIQKGLVGYITKEKTKYFQVASTSRLLDYIEVREKELLNRKAEVEALLPELERQRKGVVSKRESYVLEGFGGIKTFFRMILEEMKNGEEYYVFSLGDDLKDENTKLFLSQYHLKRAEAGVRVKIILNDDDKKGIGSWKFKGMRLRYLENPFPVGTFVFGDFVANVKFGDDPIVFVMKSKDMAKSYGLFFEDLWDKARE
ncbi:MAG: hypothetical protein PF542_04085 [Nanoarchaeota archaeon]|jgi:sugar-specific transcriptional regulator TrmB|nr:hypothetical protein [Nanoarchaeota archaeon]